MQQIAIIAVVAMFGKLTFHFYKEFNFKKKFKLCSNRPRPNGDFIAVSFGMLSISTVEKL